MENLSIEDQAAVSVVAGLNFQSGDKRDREDSPDVAGGGKPSKLVRVGELDHDVTMQILPSVGNNDVVEDISAEVEEETLESYPFFYYQDHSNAIDPDSLAPVTPPGRVPNFPAKMHAILSRPDLAEIICWMPHGRSWRVLKPREFEIRVIPTYFEHAKFSSFIRQANGWGFRRITQGRDRNSYYNPLFLRGLPHLCKEMKRPAVAQKQAADPEHEPDLYKISELHPVPDHYTDESVLLQCTLQGGPKARMPIYTGLNNTGPRFADFQITPQESKKAAAASITAPTPVQLTPRDQEALVSFEKSIDEFGNSLKKDGSAQVVAAPSAVPLSQLPMFLPQYGLGQAHMLPFDLPANSVAAGPNKMSTLAAANQLAFANSNMLGNHNMSVAMHAGASPFGNPNVAAALQASTAASQFAAGFAAATAMSQHQFRAMFESFSAGLSSQMQQNQASEQRPPQP